MEGASAHRFAESGSRSADIRGRHRERETTSVRQRTDTAFHNVQSSILNDQIFKPMERDRAQFHTGSTGFGIVLVSDWQRRLHDPVFDRRGFGAEFARSAILAIQGDQQAATSALTRLLQHSAPNSIVPLMEHLRIYSAKKGPPVRPQLPTDATKH